MGDLSFNVLVVGGGPAGASAAWEAARNGAKVLLVERHRQLGTPVQCAEFIPAMLLGEVGLGRDYVVQAVKGMKTYLPDSPVKTTRAPGYIIRRDLFDQTLAERARHEGAVVMTGTRAAGLEPDGTVRLIDHTGRDFRTKPGIIIGADGPNSAVGRWVGAVNQHLLPAVQMTLPLRRPMDHTEVYFDPDIYAGYGWLFPKGRVANVGLGMRRNGYNQESLGRVLDRFVHGLESQGKVAYEPVARTAGWIPAEPVRRAVYGNVALAGDAAGHTHSITGAGIFAAVACGRMAGKWAGRAVRENNPDLLENYDQEWKELMALSLMRAYQRRQQMEAEWTADDFSATVQNSWVAYRQYYS